MNDIETIIDNLRTVNHCKGDPDVIHYGDYSDCPHCFDQEGKDDPMPSL